MDFLLQVLLVLSLGESKSHGVEDDSALIPQYYSLCAELFVGEFARGHALLGLSDT